MNAKQITNLIKRRKEEEKIIYGKIGATIKLKRKRKQRTLNHLSEISGVSISYLSKIENNLLKPNLEYLSNVFSDLQINEDFLADSSIMNKWYLMTIKHFLNIKSYEYELKEFLKERDDFQSRLIEFCLSIKENKLANIIKTINLLLQNVSLMHPKELQIFMFSLCEYYLKIEDHFSAGEILKEFNSKNLENKLLNLWFLELKHELALYQNSFIYYSKAVNNLLNCYFSFNLIDKIKDLKEKSTAALAYFLEPNNFKDYLDDEEMYKSYRLSHIYFKKYEDFNALEKRNDLAQLLINEINGNYEEVKNRWSKVEYREDPLELAIKEYFKYKYDHNNSLLFLQETIFSLTGLSQHHHACLFLANKLIENYQEEHKYKQCHLVNERLKSLDDIRKSTLKF